MTTKLFKAAEVCDMAQLQPYVLRSWEKEFPGIGLQKSAEGPRFYRQSDLDQVLRIKQLVFGEGLTLAGARRRLEELSLSAAHDDASEMAEAFDVLSAGARTRIAQVKQGLQSILTLLESGPRTAAAEEYRLQPPPAAKEPETVGVGARAASVAAGKRSKRATA